MKELVGQQIENYRVDALLGEGGMGTVYRALDTNLARPVALKVMHPQFASKSRFQQRFMQEARSAARLDHPSIVTIYGFHRQQNLFYIVMELVPGLSLGAYFKKLAQNKQVVKLKETLNIVAQVADALGYAHQQGVMHRDIKPDNILLKPLEQPDRPDEPPIRAVVTDFGLAKLLEGGIETETGTFMGTLPYMSPEQVTSKPVDGRSDIYSLGVVLFQLATGQLPFDIQSPTDAVMKHLHEVPPAPQTIQPGLPQTLSEIILRTLAKEPDGRFQSGAELALALRQAGAQLTDEDVTTFVAASQASVVSLLTQLQAAQSFAEPSQMEVAEPLPGGADWLIIARQGEAPHTLPLEKATMTIGRTGDNDIRLNATGISRHHARLERTTMGWRIVDLGSTNGTFLAGSRLLPDVPEAWDGRQPIRIGPFFLQLQKPSASATGATYRATSVLQVPAGGTQVFSSLGRLGILVHPTHVEVAPGQRANIQLSLFNQGTTVDHFRLNLEGLPPEWVTLPEESQQLMPGSEGTMPLAIHPPRDSSARSGQHRFRLLVSSAADDQETASVSGSVTVKPMERFSLEMEPRNVRGRGQSRVLIRNEGNFDNSFQIAGRDPGEVIRFQPARSAVKIPAGAAETVALAVQPRKRPLVGRSRTFPFEVHVGTATAPPQKAVGQLEVRPLIPAWAISLVGILLALLCVGGYLIWNALGQVEKNAAQTREAIAAAGTVDALTRASGVAAAATTTQVAAEATDAAATAIALTAAAAGDDDGDGLSNAVEASLGTDPLNVDTDGDGLSDGAEVNQYGSEPKNQDTDGDTLSDGDEVNLYGTAPIIPDTDGDGALDGFEVAAATDPLDPTPATPTPDQAGTAEAATAGTATTQAIAAQTATAQAAVDASATSQSATVAAQAAADAAAAAQAATATVQAAINATATSQAATAAAQAAASATAASQAATATAQAAINAAATSQAATATAQAASIPQNDCIAYNPGDLSIVDEGASGWLLTDGRSRMLVLDNQTDAINALALAQRHTAQCFIGRDNTRPNRIDYIVEYWIGNSGISTTIQPEDCINYNENNLQIINEGASGWLLTDGSSRMLILDNQADAQNALLMASAFSEQCFIGRNNTRPDRKRYIVGYWK